MTQLFASNLLKMEHDIYSKACIPSIFRAYPDNEATINKTLFELILSQIIVINTVVVMLNVNNNRHKTSDRIILTKSAIFRALMITSPLFLREVFLAIKRGHPSFCNNQTSLGVSIVRQMTAQVPKLIP